MPFDAAKVDLIIQYALLVAGREDDFVDRQLGPIHLIKYVYLADLAYARRNHGEIFTGVDWQFYKFGPWSQSVNARIEPALRFINADMRSFDSDFEDRADWVRWNLRDERLLLDKERQLPPSITMTLSREIHRFGKDTPALLEYVYRTLPMLSAAPLERLDFSLLPESQEASPDDKALKWAELSSKKQKKFKERMVTIRERSKNTSSSKRLVNPVTQARYDETFEEGIAWLDNIAGRKLAPAELAAEFSEDVWKSSARKGEDVS